MKYILLFFLLSSCVSKEKQAKGQNSVNPNIEDTTYKKLMFDTNQVYTDIGLLIKFKQVKDSILWASKKDILNSFNNVKKSDFVFDSLLYLNEKLYNILFFKNMLKADKNELNFKRCNFLLTKSDAISFESKGLLFKMFPAALRESRIGKIYEQKIYEQRSNVGKNFLDLARNETFYDVNGIKIDSSSAWSKGGSKKVIVFSASWCKPCRYEHQIIIGRKKIFDEAKIEIISVSIDNKYDIGIRFIKEQKANWDYYLLGRPENSQMLKQLEIEGVPINILIDEAGVIIFQDSDIEKIFKYLEYKR